MFSPALTRRPLADTLLPGAAAPLAPSAARIRDLATLAIGIISVLLSLRFDILYNAQRIQQPFGPIVLRPLPAAGPTTLLIAASIALLLTSWGAARAFARDTLLIISGVLLLALGARLSIPLQPVPITGQTFAVLLIAAALGWRRGLTAIALYITLGSTGIPFFADTSSPVTYGYLAGFALAALIVGWLAERGWDRRFPSAILAMLLGEIAIFTCGVAWLATYVGWRLAPALGLTPFLLGDTLKLLAAALLLPAVWRLSGRASQTR